MVGRSTRPDPALVVLISPTHKTTNLLVIPSETVSGSNFAYNDVGANTLLEFGDKFGFGCLRLQGLTGVFVKVPHRLFKLVPVSFFIQQDVARHLLYYSWLDIDFIHNYIMVKMTW